MKAEIPAALLQKLARLVRITGHVADDNMAVVLCHPNPRTDWTRFIRKAASANIEVAKQITMNDRGHSTYIWRLSIPKPSNLLVAINNYDKPSPPEEEPKPAEGESVSCPGFDDVMNVLAVETLDSGERIIYALPSGNLAWKDVVEGLLTSGRALDIAKTYFVDEADNKIKYIWRIVWKTEAQPPVSASVPSPPKKEGKDICKEIGLPQAGSSELEELNRAALEKAQEIYRQRHGMVLGSDGKWRVPLDPYGRVTKAVLFNPERACWVPGIDYTKTGEVTREMLEKPERLGRPERGSG